VPTDPTVTAIRREFEQAAPGALVPTSRLLRHGTRAAVDQALSRLERAGEITRAARGVYYRPKISRLAGAVPPEPQALVNALAESRGESIAVHGAEAARRLGLSTQAPLSPVFLTSGRSRTVKLSRLSVQLRHAAPKELVLAGTPAGDALRALRYLGPEHVTAAVIGRVRDALSVAEFTTLRNATYAMPAWLSDELYRFEHLQPGTPARRTAGEPAVAPPVPARRAGRAPRHLRRVCCPDWSTAEDPREGRLALLGPPHALRPRRRSANGLQGGHLAPRWRALGCSETNHRISVG
jgi:Family of unknown function (DUF6088)